MLQAFGKFAETTMFAVKSQEKLEYKGCLQLDCRNLWPFYIFALQNDIKWLSMPIGHFLENRDLKFKNVVGVWDIEYHSVQGDILVRKLIV